MNAHDIAALVKRGDLIPVQVFGSEGYGLCDRFSEHANAGSDCNRAAFFLLRPSDDIMKSGEVRFAITQVLETPDEDLWA